MSFRISTDEPPGTALRRIACEQLDKAIDAIDAPKDRDEAVHQVRKRGKKIRGLLRLARPQFEQVYAAENAFLRDAAGRLSQRRDAEAMIETLDKLRRDCRERIDGRVFSHVRRWLTGRRTQIAQAQRADGQPLKELVESLSKARKRVEDWPLDGVPFDVLMRGLKKTYRRGRRAMAHAYAAPTAEAFHEWRKRAKYHWHHVQLVQSLWPAPLKARRDEVKQLSDLLGDDHDLSVLRETVRTHGGEFANAHCQALIALIDARHAELRAGARPLGARIYAEKPKALRRRLRRYWEISQRF